MYSQGLLIMIFSNSLTSRVDDTVMILNSFQFRDEYGEDCKAWRAPSCIAPIDWFTNIFKFMDVSSPET